MIPAVLPTPTIAPLAPTQSAAAIESIFSDLVEQMVGDAVPVAPLPLIKGNAPPIAAPLSDLPATTLPAVRTADEKIPTMAPSAPRRPDTRQATAPDTSTAQAPALAVDQPVLQIPLPPKPPLPAPGNGAEESKPLALPALHDTPSRIALEPKPMLDVKIHLDSPEAPSAAPILSAPPASQPPTPARPDAPVAIQPASAQNSEGSPSQQNPQSQHRGTSDSAPQQPSPTPRVTDSSSRAPDATDRAVTLPPPTHSDAAAPPAQAPVANPAAPSAPIAQAVPAAPINMPRPHLPAPSAPLQANPQPDIPRPQQPLRSMALEFTPDGANDIKVRLSERGGDVHISLHGTDPTLAGRVREGVSDLVGSLSKAGYDAEAWTPSQGRQQERGQEPRHPAQQSKNNSDAGEFSSIFQPSTQENS